MALATNYIVNEDRLDALAGYGILDTPPEEGFDSIVELATTICACPVALVSLVDRDRQWFKARVGFPPCETDLNSSVCAYALIEPDILVIPDLKADPRTAANPLVTGEPHIRFYAGAPLRTADGHVLGSLCVIDKKPRPGGLTPVQASSLKALAAQVLTQLELRRSIESHRRSIEQGEALIRTQSAISAAQGDLDAILQALMAGAMEVVPHAEGGTIEMLEGDELVYRATAGTIAHELGLRVPLMDSMAGKCLLSGKAVMSGDVVTERQVKPAFVERLKLRSCVIVPIFLAGKAVGVLKLQSNRVNAFTSDDLRLARVFSGAVTTGLADAAYRRQMGFLQSTLDLGDKLRDVATIGQVAPIASELAGRALDLLFAGYGVVDPQAETVTILDNWGPHSLKGDYSFRDFGSYIDELKRGQPVIINDVARDPRTAGNVESFQALGIASLFNLPIFERGRFVSIFFAHKAKPHAWSVEELAFLGAIGDRTAAAITRLQAEEQQALLNEELSHRMKNTMAMVQAVAVQTLKDVTERAAVAAFTERVHALSAAHDVLLQASWSAAHIKPVITAVLGKFRQQERFDIDGPDIGLGPRSVLSLSMLLHELATNAIKYGALSVEGGQVRLAWRLEPGAEGEELVIDWVERGGPPATAPTRKGFGSRLIRLGLVGTGGVTLDYQTLGFSAEMRALLAHVQQS